MVCTPDSRFFEIERCEMPAVRTPAAVYLVNQKGLNLKFKALRALN